MIKDDQRLSKTNQRLSKTIKDYQRLSNTIKRTIENTFEKHKQKL